METKNYLQVVCHMMRNKNGSARKHTVREREMEFHGFVAGGKSRKAKFFPIAIGLMLIATIWIAWGNTALEVNTYSIMAEHLPESFDGYRIAHVSDLHNAQFGENNEKLLQIIAETKPDMIAITGDLIDSYHTDIQVGIDFAKQAVQIAPTYYVTGNHEARIDEYEELKKGLMDAGVVLLQNEGMELEKDGESITCIGVDDPSFQTDYLFGDAATVMDTCLKELMQEVRSDGLRQEMRRAYMTRDICASLPSVQVRSGLLERDTPRTCAINDISASWVFAEEFLLEGDSDDFQDKNYTLLLSHRPELFEVYAANDIDLVLSGHAHGGQFRLPFAGGVIAPNQGFFPTYDAGLYVEERTHMIVSRGIGNSLFPFRVNNPPEVILVILQKSESGF